jgi:hypothetical protein
MENTLKCSLVLSIHQNVERQMQSKHHDCRLPILNRAHKPRAMVVHPKLSICITSLTMTRERHQALIRVLPHTAGMSLTWNANTSIRII